jgi:hypothetical protein
MSILLTRIKPARIFLIILFLVALFFFSFSLSHSFTRRTQYNATSTTNLDYESNDLGLAIDHPKLVDFASFFKQFEEISESEEGQTIQLANSTTSQNSNPPVNSSTNSVKFTCAYPKGQFMVTAPTGWEGVFRGENGGNNCTFKVKTSSSSPDSIFITPAYEGQRRYLYTANSGKTPSVGTVASVSFNNLGGAGHLVQDEVSLSSFVAAGSGYDYYFYSPANLSCDNTTDMWGTIQTDVALCYDGAILVEGRGYYINCRVPKGVAPTSRCSNLLGEIGLERL